jgi:hypothetical protein
LGTVETLESVTEMDGPQAPKPEDWSAFLLWWRFVGIGLGELIVFVTLWWTVKGRTDLIARLIVSPIVGAISGVPVREQLLHWPATPAYIVPVFAACTFLAWPAMGVAIRLIESYQGPKK